VGVGSRTRRKPVICVELEQADKGKKKRRLKEELLQLASQHEHTKNIDSILFHKAFPVDIRHNSKIFREKLAVWAEKKVK
jgi:hypothetical protein